MMSPIFRVKLHKDPYFSLTCNAWLNLFECNLPYKGPIRDELPFNLIHFHNGTSYPDNCGFTLCRDYLMELLIVYYLCSLNKILLHNPPSP